MGGAIAYAPTPCSSAPPDIHPDRLREGRGVPASYNTSKRARIFGAKTRPKTQDTGGGRSLPGSVVDIARCHSTDSSFAVDSDRGDRQRQCQAGGCPFFGGTKVKISLFIKVVGCGVERPYPIRCTAPFNGAMLCCCDALWPEGEPSSAPGEREGGGGSV